MSVRTELDGQFKIIGFYSHGVRDKGAMLEQFIGSSGGGETLLAVRRCSDRRFLFSGPTIELAWRIRTSNEPSL